MVLVEVEAGDETRDEDLTVLALRWSQEVRYGAVRGIAGVSARAAHGVSLALPLADVIGGLRLAQTMLEAPRG